MRKNLLILSNNERNDSSLIGNEFLRGANLKNVNIRKINTNEKNVNECNGCCKCKYNNGKCIYDDDMCEIYKEALLAEIIVIDCQQNLENFNHQIKKIIDRMFAVENNCKDKIIYLLVSDFKLSVDCYDNIYDSYLKKYFSRMRVNGNKLGGCVVDLKNDSNAVKKAFEMGIAV